MRVLSLFVLSFFFSFFAIGQTNYSVSSIPANLLQRAGAVIRTSETVIEVKKLDEVHYRNKCAVTILNSSAADEASLYLGYDKTTSIKSVKGTIYNEFGLVIGKITEKSFQDRSAVSDGSLYDDDRVKFYAPAKLDYPFTIEYEYEVKTRQSLYFPTWVPGNATGVAIENSTLQFICPESFNFRYKNFNYSGTVNESTDKAIKSYKWQVNNILAVRDEPYSPDYEKYLVTVKLAPESFAYKNIKGSFSNWQEFGKWMTDDLLKGRDKVPETTKHQILNLVKGISDPKEKAKKIYEFMQAKTRYISVQIGIGGYQPYSAEEVDRLGYGDCKGLANYMHSLLKIADIESYYSIVYAGAFKRDIIPDFTSMQGNHIILCLPFKNDTTWLECTNKFSPFGFLGDFTDDRYVVACTPEGGKIMRTPKLTAQNNKQIRTASFKIDDTGSLSGSVKTLFSGSQYDNHHTLLNEAYTEQKKKLSKLYPLPNLEIQSLEFVQDKSLIPETREVISLNSYNYCLINQGRLHIRLNGINKMRPLKEISNRKNPVCVIRGYYDEDIFSYQIPEGYKLSLPPKPKIIENNYGRYASQISIEGNTILYKREMLLNEGNYNPEQYEELVGFFQAIADADNIEAVLLKI